MITFDPCVYTETEYQDNPPNQTDVTMRTREPITDETSEVKQKQTREETK